MEQVSTTSTADALPVFVDDVFMSIQPTTGSHNERYIFYRATSPPPVLHRLTQRGAAAIGVGEDTLRFSIRWVESKLNKWKSNNAGSSQYHI